jgi:hypothetical protein
MPVNTHVVGRSRNCTEPFARLRDPGGSGHSVAQLLCGLDDRLSLCREIYVLARISSKCRCAKRERERDACAPDRPAAQATWSAYCFHAVIVMPLRISCKPISSVVLRHKSDILRRPDVFEISPSKGNAAGEDWSDELLLLRSGYLPLQQVSHR